VSPSKELRDASNAAEALVRDYGVESSMRLDVFKAKVAAQENLKKSGEKLSPEQQRLIEKMVCVIDASTVQWFELTYCTFRVDS
jgi:metallopeptidase MepB